MPLVPLLARRTQGPTVGRQWCDPFGVRLGSGGSPPVGSHEVQQGRPCHGGKHDRLDALGHQSPGVLLASCAGS